MRWFMREAGGRGLFAVAFATALSSAAAQPFDPVAASLQSLELAPVVAPAAPWAQSFAAFEAADLQAMPAPGGLLFVGSSSIRLWDGLESQFAGFPAVTRRGFGGSRMSDVTRHLDRLVLPYRPARIVVYAGENDIAEGRSPQDVLASFEVFVKGVRGQLPLARIAYISIKPSPRRAALMPLFRETNTLVSAFAASVEGVDFIDVFSHMLEADGTPQAELFRDDALHLDEDGYALWRTHIAGSLR